MCDCLNIFYFVMSARKGRYTGDLNVDFMSEYCALTEKSKESSDIIIPLLIIPDILLPNIIHALR